MMVRSMLIALKCETLMVHIDFTFSMTCVFIVKIKVVLYVRDGIPGSYLSVGGGVFGFNFGSF